MVGVTRVCILAVVLVTAVLVGCTSAIDVHTAQAPSAHFERYRTFSFEIDRQAPPGFSPSPQSAHVKQRVEQLTAKVLETKGYTQAEPASGDMTVRVSAGRRAREIRLPERARPDWLMEDEENDFVEGSFVIDAFDSASGEMVWHGAARLEVDPGAVDEARLRRAVSSVLTSFPPK